MNKSLFFLLLSCTLATGQIITSPGGGGISASTLYASSGANLFAAKTAATAGTTIVVGPGLYTVGVTNLLKDRVNWFFYPGAFVSNSVAQNCSIFCNDAFGETGAINCSIDGWGEFYSTNNSGSTVVTGILSVSNAASRISFRAKTVRAFVDFNLFFSSISIQDCAAVSLDIDWIDNPNDGSCMSWDNGFVTARINRMTSSAGTGLVCLGNKFAQCMLTVGSIINTNFIAIEFNPTSAENRLYLTADDILSGIVQFTIGGCAFSQTGGYAELDVKRMGVWHPSGPGDENGATLGIAGGVLNARIGLLTTTNIQPMFIQQGGFADLQIQEWRDQGAASPNRPYSILISGGTNWIRNGKIKTAGGPAIKLTAGEMHLEDMVVNTFSTLTPSNNCVWITGGTPVFKNCAFIPGSFFSITNNSAGDMRVYGNCFAKSNYTVTLTLRPATAAFVIDGTYVDR